MSSQYGGQNDRALWLVQNCGLEFDECFLLRAREDTGEIVVKLMCSDVFLWACADTEDLPPGRWREFEDSLSAVRDELCDWRPLYFIDAWAVRLRQMAPQKRFTDRAPKFVEMLDRLAPDWRTWPRMDGTKPEDDMERTPNALQAPKEGEG